MPEQAHQVRLCAFCGQSEVALLGESRVHRRERDLEDLRRRLGLEVPGVERSPDAGTEADGVGKADRRVVAEGKPCDVPVWISAEVVVTVACNRACERLERCLLGGEPRRIVGGGVAPVQPNLRTGVEDRLDQLRS